MYRQWKKWLNETNKFAKRFLNSLWKILVSSCVILSDTYHNHLKFMVFEIYDFIYSKILPSLYSILNNVYDTLTNQYLVIRNIMIERLPLIINDLKIRTDNLIDFVGQKSIELVKNEINGGSGE